MAALLDAPGASAQPRGSGGSLDPAQVNRDVRQSTQGLEADMGEAWARLRLLAHRVQALRDRWRDAKKLADAAERLAERARDAARKCETAADRARVEALISQARRNHEDARFAKDMAEIAETGIKNDVEETVRTAERRVTQLGDSADRGLADAKKAGFDDRSVMMGNLRDARAALDREAARLTFTGTEDKGFADRGALARVRQGADLFKPELEKAKEAFDPTDPLRRAGELLKQAEEYLAKCPPPPGTAGPKKPPEVFVAVDNRPHVNVCVPAGQDPGLVAEVLALAEYRVIAKGADGAIVRAPGDARTVEKAAKDKGVTLGCVEPDFCEIFTPLTPFRAHHHRGHHHASPHDHEMRDLPADWGFTPGPAVIPWEPDS